MCVVVCLPGPNSLHVSHPRPSRPDTKYLKPVTLIKNIAVAFICALAPLVGALTAASSSVFGTFGLTMVTFLGILHRELLMDIPDMTRDAATGVRTVPVVFGARAAAVTALACAGAMGTVAVGEGLRAIVFRGGGGGSVSAMRNILRLVFAVVGSALMVERASRAVTCSATDREAEAAAAVEATQRNFPILLLSFV